MIRGGGAMSVAAAAELLTTIGFSEIRNMIGVSQALVMARKP